MDVAAYPEERCCLSPTSVQATRRVGLGSRRRTHSDLPLAVTVTSELSVTSNPSLTLTDVPVRVTPATRRAGVSLRYMRLDAPSRRGTDAAAAEPAMLSGTGKGGGAEVIRPGDAFLPMRAGRPTRLLARRRPTWSFNHLVRAARYAGFACADVTSQSPAAPPRPLSGAGPACRRRPSRTAQDPARGTSAAPGRRRKAPVQVPRIRRQRRSAVSSGLYRSAPGLMPTTLHAPVIGCLASAHRASLPTAYLRPGLVRGPHLPAGRTVCSWRQVHGSRHGLRVRSSDLR
jgi:hypothetical protein